MKSKDFRSHVKNICALSLENKHERFSIEWPLSIGKVLETRWKFCGIYPLNRKAVVYVFPWEVTFFIPRTESMGIHLQFFLTVLTNCWLGDISLSFSINNWKTWSGSVPWKSCSNCWGWLQTATAFVRWLTASWYSPTRKNKQGTWQLQYTSRNESSIY